MTLGYECIIILGVGESLTEVSALRESQVAETTPALKAWLAGAEQKRPRRGDLVMGTIVALDAEGAWVDIGTKSEGFVPPSEMLTLGRHWQAKPGDEVQLYVLRADDDSPVVLSLDRAWRHRGWQELEAHYESGEPIEAEACDFNRGGLIVDCHGLSGFVPLSQIAGNPSQDGLALRLGDRLKLKVLKLNRGRRQIILSERAALHHLKEQQRKALLADLKPGEVRRGRVSGVHSFGLFVDLGGIDGLVPASEISWAEDNHNQASPKPGEELDVYIMKVDQACGRVVLSLRRTQPHPWETIAHRYQEGQLVTGTITKLVDFGAFARIDGGIEGLVHISELAERRISHPKEVVQRGEALTLKILSIEPQRRRLRLSLRQAQWGG